MKPITIIVAGILLAACFMAAAAEIQAFADKSLPDPVRTGGKPLMETLHLRQSSREFGEKALSDQVLSNLLWAAAGINRPETGKRTAPSARNWQEVSVYVVLAEGIYRYDACGHMLKGIKPGDYRKLTGMQAFAGTAPLNLVYVADTAKMSGETDRETQALYSAADTGFISQNVYLFCASEGLVTVVRGSVDRDALSKAMDLSDTQTIILAQTIGYPPEP